MVSIRRGGDEEERSSGGNRSKWSEFRARESANKERADCSAQKPARDNFGNRVRVIEDPGDSSQQADKQAGDGADARVASHAPGKECDGDGPDSGRQGRMPADHAKSDRGNLEPASSVQDFSDAGECHAGRQKQYPANGEAGS